MLKGLSRFLIEHEPHGQGFDVAHPTGVGSGRVSITCRGCGSSHEYSTTTVGFERERPAPAADPPPVPAPPAQTPFPSPVPAAIPAETPGPGLPRYIPPGPEIGKPGRRIRPGRRVGPAPEPAPKAVESVEEAKREKERRPSRLRSALLIAAAAAVLAFAFVRVTGDDGDEPNPTPTTAQQAPTTTPGPGPAIPTPPQPAPAPPEPEVISAKTFTVEVPAGWERSPSPQGLLLVPASEDSASLQVYSDPDPGAPLMELSSKSADVLRSESGSEPSAPRPAKLDGQPAFEITANGGGDTYTAVGSIANGNRYLVIATEADDAQGDIDEQLKSAIASLKLQ